MNEETLIREMTNIPKGANIVVEWIRPAKTLKDVSDTILKHVRMVGRIGIEYDNLGVVKQKRENGQLPIQNAGPKGMTYEIYPYLLRSDKSRKLHLRLFKSTCSAIKPHTKWFLNGTEVNKEDISEKLLASEKGDSEGDCFSVGVENICRLHHVSEVELAQETEPTQVPVEV